MDVIISQPSKTAMQSGRGKTKYWQLRFVDSEARYIEPLLGWRGSRTTVEQVLLKFSTLEEAITYAKQHSLTYQVVPAQQRQVKPKSYADNYKYKLS